MNCFTTFAAESGRKLALRTYAGFVASGLAGVVAGTAALVIAAMFVHILVAKLIAIAVSFALNFSKSIGRGSRHKAGFSTAGTNGALLAKP